MKSHAVTPTFLDFRDNFSYGAVSEDPLPYADVHVLWSGRIAALEVEEQIRFDLLVGYENFQFSEGILPIVLDFPALLENGQAVEVIGQVKINQNGGFFLQGKSVRTSLLTNFNPKTQSSRRRACVRSSKGFFCSSPGLWQDRWQNKTGYPPLFGR
jgi:hypothetical protein